MPGRTRTRRTPRGAVRERQITLAYDPAEGTLRADTGHTAQTITLKAS